MHLTNPILFDLDNTLIDTVALMRVFVIPTLEKTLGVTPAEFDSINQSYRDSLVDSTAFDPTSYVEHLSATYKVPAATLSEAFFDQRFFEKSLFSETVGVLQALQNQYELGIFSQALITEYQFAKLKLSGILPFFNQELLFISEDKTSKKIIQNLPAGATIIDDRIRFLQPLVDSRPDLQLIWLNRTSTEKNSDFATIHSLLELL